MTQISPIGNNPFSMFKMVDMTTPSRGMVQPVQNNMNATAQNSVPATQNTSAPSGNNIINKKINKKTIAIIGGVLAAAVGIVIAIKSHKTHSLKGDAVQELKDAAQPLLSSAPEVLPDLSPKGAAVLNELADNLSSAPEVLPDLSPKVVDTVSEKLADGLSQIKPDVANFTAQLPPVAEAGSEGVKLAVNEVPQVIEAAAQDVSEKIAHKAKEVSNKSKEIRFVITAFSVGLIAKAFKEIIKSDSVQAANLQKQILEKESYLKDIEIPYIRQEAQEYYENYKQDILTALDYFEPNAQYLTAKYNEAIVKYAELDDGSYAEFFDGTNDTKLEVQRRENGSTKVREFSPDGKGSTVTYYTFEGRPLSIEFYQGDKLKLKAKYKLSPMSAEPYLSQMFVYTKGSKKASMISFDEELNPKYYLARDNQGRLIKAFDIDSNSLDVKTITLPAKDGESWLKKYNYESDGQLKSVVIMPSNDLPARRYNFDDGVLEGLDLYANINEAPILHVPFETLAQPEFIE